MIDEQQLNINAICNTLDLLKMNEPKCICEQCVYGYKSDKLSIKECHLKKHRITYMHTRWQERIEYWEKKLNDVRKIER